MIQQLNGDSQDFAEAYLRWDVERLIKDIEEFEKRLLTKAEKRNLLAILLGLSASQAQDKMKVAKKTRSLDGYFNKIRRTIELFLDLESSTLKTSHDVVNVLASYRKGQELPPSSEFYLLGRDADRQKLIELSPKHKIVLIKAGAGVGKSTLAREFLQTQFKKVIRIEMGLESGNVTLAEEKVSQILRKDFDEEPSRDFGINLDILRERLSDCANPIAVLIDNLEPALDENYRFREKLRGYDALLAVLGDRDVFSFTLITSRRSLIAQRVKIHEYELEGLDITAWQQYFHDCENGANSKALMKMRDAYNGNAKAMDILHGVIKNRFNGNIEAYWDQYSDALLANRDLEDLISREMDWLRDNRPDAYNLLCRMGCYRYQDVKTVPFKGLTCLLWDVPQSRRALVVDYLSKTSLIEVKGEYYLHPAIRDAAISRLIANKVDWRKSNQEAAIFWTESVKLIMFTDDLVKAFEAYYQYININDLESAGEVLVRERKYKQKEDGRPLALGINLLHHGLFSIPIDEIKNNIIAKIDSNTALYARLTNVIGNHYIFIGELKIGIAIHELCLHSSRETSNYFLICASLINLGRIYIILQDFESAHDILVILKNLHSDNSFKEDFEYFRLDCSCYLAFVYSKLGFKDKSLCLANWCFNVRQQAKKRPSEYFYLYGLIYLGKTYVNLNDIDKAMYVITQVIHISTEYSYSEILGIAFVEIGKINYINHRHQNSTYFCKYGIDILKKAGVKYRLAEAYFQLGLTCQATGDNNQAEEYKAEALKLFAEMEVPKQCERANKAFGGNNQ